MISGIRCEGHQGLKVAPVERDFLSSPLIHIRFEGQWQSPTLSACFSGCNPWLTDTWQKHACSRIFMPVWRQYLYKTCKFWEVGTQAWYRVTFTRHFCKFILLTPFLKRRQMAHSARIKTLPVIIAHFSRNFSFSTCCNCSVLHRHCAHPWGRFNKFHTPASADALYPSSCSSIVSVTQNSSIIALHINSGFGSPLNQKKTKVNIPDFCDWVRTQHSCQTEQLQRLPAPFLLMTLSYAFANESGHLSQLRK